jgi:hypothetical protein
MIIMVQAMDVGYLLTQNTEILDSRGKKMVQRSPVKPGNS